MSDEKNKTVARIKIDEKNKNSSENRAFWLNVQLFYNFVKIEIQVIFGNLT